MTDREQLGIALNEFASFLQTMTAINEHQGYQFTQVLMVARDNLKKMQERYASDAGAAGYGADEPSRDSSSGPAASIAAQDADARETDHSAFQQAWLDIPSQDNEGYVPHRGGFKSGWFAALRWERARAQNVRTQWHTCGNPDCDISSYTNVGGGPTICPECGEPAHPQQECAHSWGHYRGDEFEHCRKCGEKGQPAAKERP